MDKKAGILVLLSVSLIETFMAPLALADDSYYNKGTHMLQAKRYREAIAYFNISIGKGTKFIAAYNNRGCAYAALGYEQKAIDDFTAALKVDPNDDTSLVNRASSYARLKKYDLALKDLNHAADVFYKNADKYLAKIYFERAAVYHQMKRFNEGMEDCRRVLAFPKVDPNLRKNADSLYKWCQVGIQKEIALGVLKSAEFVKEKNYDKAEKELERVEKYDPHSISILLLETSVAVLQKKLDKATQKANDAIKYNPKDGKAYLALADVMFAKANYDEAAGNLSKAMDHGVRSAEIYELRALSYMLAGSAEPAVKDLNEILRLRPKSVSALMLRGICSIISRDTNQMITDGKAVMDNETITTDKGMHGALLAYDGLLRSDRKVEANAFLNDCMEKAPKDKWPYQIFQFIKGEIDKDALLKAASSQQEKEDAHAWAGILALRNGDKENANSELLWCKESGDCKNLSYVMLAAALVTPRVQSPVVG